MKRWWIGFLAGLVAGVIVSPVALADYYNKQGRWIKEEKSTLDQGFDSAVSLKKFRKGNPDWDTQELIHSGLSALHREHVKILQEIEALKKEMEEVGG